MIYYSYMFMMAAIVFFIVYFLCSTLWFRFRPLTADEKKIFDSFRTTLQNNGFVKVDYSILINGEKKYTVDILNHQVIVSTRLGSILEKLYSKHLNERRKTDYSKFIEAIYSEVFQKYSNAPQTQVVSLKKTHKYFM